MEINEEQLRYGGKDEAVLKKFIDENFDIKQLTKAGFFTKEMKGNYYAMAVRICVYFGYESIFEYGAQKIRCHVSYPRKLSVSPKGELVCDPFITIIKSIY